MIHEYHDQVSSRGKLLGTCAGLADRSGVPVTLLRIALVVALCVSFKLTVLGYCVAALALRADRG